MNLLDAQRCARCSAALLGRVDLGPARRRWNRLRNAATIALRPAMLLRWRMQLILGSEAPAGQRYRNPWFAAWLSLVPGLGQWYNRQRLLGALTLGVFAMLAAGAVRFILSPLSDLLFLAALLVMLWSMNHALTTAQEINGGIGVGLGMRRWLGFFVMLGATAFVLWGIQYIAVIWVAVAALLFGTATLLATIGGRRARGQGGYLFLLVLAALWGAFGRGVWESPTWMWHSVIRLQRQGQTRFEPFIVKGDRLLIETISQSWRGIQLGDIVLYDPPSYAIEIPGALLTDVHVVNMPINLERVVGLPGDVIERRDGVFYRNGKRAPPLHQPLIQDEMPANYRIDIPAGHYGIMISYTPTEWMPTKVGLYGSRPDSAKRLDGISRLGTPVILLRWHEAAVIPARDIFGRVLMAYYPWARRRWLDGKVPDAFASPPPSDLIQWKKTAPGDAPLPDGGTP